VTVAVTEEFLAGEKDDSKVMADNYYSFAYQKMEAQHSIYFMDYTAAEEKLRYLLKAELAFYGMQKKTQEEPSKEAGEEAAKEDGPESKKEEPRKPLAHAKPKFEQIDFEAIDLACLTD